jgi:hypothetical protein
MEGRAVFSFFVDASGHGYYRPVSFALWQALYLLLGRHDPFALHLLNVLAHAANAALVGWLAWRLTAPFASEYAIRNACLAAPGQPARASQQAQYVNLAYAFTAGVLFALYPFSYEAVPYVGSFVHPLVTFFVLLTLAFYLNWRKDGSWHWFAAAHVTLGLAVFTQENGIIAPLLILALEVLSSSFLHLTPHVLRFTFYVSRFSFFIEPILFVVAWLLVPKSSAVERVISLAAAQSNVLPFVQALVYPVAPFAQRNLDWLAMIAVVAILGVFLLARALRQTRLLIFALLLWGLAVLPSIVLLDPAYVAGSPRLFYLGSVGAALLWALPVRVFDYATRNALRYCVLRIAYCVLALAFYVFLFTFTLPYTTCQLRYQGYAGEAGQMVAKATRQAGRGQSVTFVNLPYFFGSRGPGMECPRPFAFAPTGAVVIPLYADARDFAVYNGGMDAPIRAATFEDYAPGWASHGAALDAAGLRAALATSRVFVFDLTGWQLRDLSAMWKPEEVRLPFVAALGNAIQLQQVEVSKLTSGVVITLTWQAVSAPGRDYTVFAQLLDDAGQLIAQHDGPPASGWVPTRLWQPGDRIVDTHVITAPLRSGRIIVGMYNPATGVRLTAIGADGLRWPDDAITIGIY